MTTPIVQIPDDLRGCHPLITKTRRLLKQSKPDERNLKHAVGAGTLNVHVSPGSVDRALKILEAVIRGSESRGWGIAVPDAEKSAEIRIGDDPISFGISEKVTRFEVETDDPEKGKWYWRPRYRYESTGLLALEIFEYVTGGLRRIYSDGKRQRLEDLLPEFLDGAELISAAVRARRLKWEEWERQRRLDELQRQELARKIKKETARRAQLEMQLTGWQQANVLQQIIVEVRRRSEAGAPEWPANGAGRWLIWAEGMARRLDPFANGYFSEALADEGADSTLDCR